MSRDKLILIGVVVLGLLGFLVYKQQQQDASMGRASVASKDLPTISAPEDVDKISITNGEKGEVVFERVPDPKGTPGDAGPPTMWQMTKPLKALTNQQAVKDLAANLKDLKVDSQVNLKLDDDVRKEKELDPPHAVHVVAWKGGDKKVDESFGKSGKAGQLVMLADKPDAVFAAKGYSSYLYTKDVKDFREKEIFKFDDASASQVTIANSHGAFSFTKGDKWVGTLDKKPIARFDGEKVKDMLRAYKNLNAEDFADGKSTADTGLDKPESTVSIELKDGAGKYEILIGSVSTGTNRWAKRADSDTIIQLGNFSAEWATSDVSKYQSAADAGAPDAGGATKSAKK
jgi:hypothetical protein